MTECDRPKLARVLGVFSEVFNEPVSDLRAEAYFAAFSDLDIAVVEQAAREVLRTCKFFPRPAELRELVEGNITDAAGDAWVGLLRAVRQTGSWGKPELPSATWNALESIWGSWQRLCETLPNEGPELLGWRKQFLSGYQAAHARTRRELNAGDIAKELPPHEGA